MTHIYVQVKFCLYVCMNWEYCLSEKTLAYLSEFSITNGRGHIQQRQVGQSRD